MEEFTVDYTSTAAAFPHFAAFVHNTFSVISVVV